jgi:uncharacterized protein YgiM (DUF1202 family)
LVALATRKRPRAPTGFGTAARASSTGELRKPVRRAIGHTTNRAGKDVGKGKEEKAGGLDKEAPSMDLNLTGRVTADSLRVRKRPGLRGPIIDKLPAGQRVKVTEKRLANESMWYRVITPSGKAGWVDFRYLKLDL